MWSAMRFQSLNSEGVRGRMESLLAFWSGVEVIVAAIVDEFGAVAANIRRELFNRESVSCWLLVFRSATRGLRWLIGIGCQSRRAKRRGVGTRRSLDFALHGEDSLPYPDIEVVL